MTTPTRLVERIGQCRDQPFTVRGPSPMNEKLSSPEATTVMAKPPSRARSSGKPARASKRAVAKPKARRATRPQPVNFAELLLWEKKRRGVPPARLVFVGIHNLAQYWWCAQYAVLKSRANETDFFRAWLEDRLSHSMALGRIQPTASLIDALTVGDDITMADMELLLSRLPVDRSPRKKDQTRGIAYQSWGNIVYINPALDAESRARAEEWAVDEGLQLGDVADQPFIRGELLESTLKERYPTLRWNWRWGDYVLIGVPDGITSRFVYEFKSTQRAFFANYKQPVAETQADLYGYFWNRRLKRIQRYVCESRKTETIELPVDRERAEITLRRFQLAEAGIRVVPPVAWKCNACEYRQTCPLSRAGRE